MYLISIACKNEFVEWCGLLIVLDGHHIKGDAGIDEDNQMYPIVFAIVES